MQDYGKYIIASNDCAILFHPSMTHSDFANFNPKSAGFYELYVEDDKIDIEVFGKSTSLKIGIKDKGDDIFKIKQALNLLDSIF